MSQHARLELIRDLRERLGHIECANRWPEVYATGIIALDRLLPREGLQAGTLLEWLSEGEGSGAATLALAVSARLLEKGGALVVLDNKGEFYPPAAASLGIPLERTVIVQPANSRDALWAIEQALRSGTAVVTVGSVRELNGRAFRRLQLAAEVGGGLGFLLRPLASRAEPSWAAARLLVKSMPRAEPTRQACGRRLQIELLHCRGGVSGEVVEVDLSDEASHVQLVSRLAHPAPRRRTAGA